MWKRILLVLLIASPLSVSNVAVKEAGLSVKAFSSQVIFPFNWVEGGSSRNATFGDDKYRIVLPKIYNSPYSEESTGSKAEKKRKRQADITAAYNVLKDDFIQELNRMGEENFRVVSTIDFPLAAIVKRDTTPYQYEGFLTHSRLFFRKEGFDERHLKYIKEGFSFVDHLLLNKQCASPSYNAETAYLNGIEDCIYTDFYLLERVKGAAQTKEVALVRRLPNWRKTNGTDDFAKRILDYQSIGYYPTHAFSRFEILLQRHTLIDPSLRDTSDLRVVTGNLERQTKKLTQQGYRIVLVFNEIAVMARSMEPKQSPSTYSWLYALQKNFETNLNNLQKAGAIYRMSYSYYTDCKCTLIFEQPAVRDERQHEYKVIKFMPEAQKNISENGFTNNPEMSVEMATRKINDLAKEGFEVRDLFLADRLSSGIVSILLERTR